MRAAAEHRRAGMSILEIVMAVALLGIVSASMFGVFGFMTGSQLRQNQQLAAMEVANRTMLQYLDDPTKMADPRRPVEYGPADAPARFRWEYIEQPIQIIEPRAEMRDSTRQSGLSRERLRQVTVRVWLSEESGGSRRPEAQTPQATITRLVDPVYPRNPDSFMNMLQDPAGFQQMMENIMGFSGGMTVRGGVPGGPGQSGPRMPGQRNFGAGQMRPGEAVQRGGQRGSLMGRGLSTGRGAGGPGGAGGAGGPGGARGPAGVVPMSGGRSGGGR